MKNLYLITFFVLLISSITNSQWTNQNPVPNGNDLWSTFYIDDNTGWIVGSDGFIKKTTNAGIDWFQQNSGTNLILKSVQFINQNIGWICGESGLILKTKNGGLNWFSLTTGTNEHLTDIHFYDIDNGYTVGFSGTILKTTDGGSTWIAQYSGTSSNIYSVDFLDGLVGYAVGGEYGSYAILKTTDGGLSWINKGSDFFYYYSFLLTVNFIDVNTGFIGGGYSYQNIIFKTTDGGETWVDIELSTNGLRKEQNQEEQTIIYKSGGINSIFFDHSMIGYAVGGNSYGWDRKIFTTTDAGATWNRKYIGWEENGLISVFGKSNGQALAVGFTGTIFITENDGNSWQQILSGNRSSACSGDDLYSVFCINENIGWAVGYRASCLGGGGNTVLKTTNGGKIWKTQLIDQYQGGRIRSVYFINEDYGWAVGEGTTSFYRTTDGGENWIEGVGLFSSVIFINQYTGWATSDNYNQGIYKSTDGGITWRQKSPTSSSRIYFSEVNIGWAIGEAGSILKSTDGGETWVPKMSGITNNLNSIKFFNLDLGICVGNEGIVLLSTDGGENWVSQNVGTTEALTSVCFTNSSTIWIAGSNGTILNTTDLGTTWISYNEVTENDLTSVCFANENTGWFGGRNGTIFKYQNDVVPVEFISFTANENNNLVKLNWNTSTETNNYGFEIERKQDNSEWETIGFIKGHGTTTELQEYSYIDDIKTLQAKLFLYRLKQIDFAGSYKYSYVVELEVLPTQYELSQNYPNPFNPITKIEFSIPEDISNVTLSIYNMLGEKVTELVNESLSAGRHSYQWNAQNVATGIYIYELRTDKFASIKKMILIK